MAHDNNQGFLSSLFGKKKQKANEEIEKLELKQKLEARIRQVLADTVEAPELLTREATPVEVPMLKQVEQPEEQEAEVNLLPISASVITARKAPAQASFLISGFDAPRSYAASER
jgi:hypothetical protein